MDFALPPRTEAGARIMGVGSLVIVFLSHDDLVGSSARPSAAVSKAAPWSSLSTRR